MDLHGQIMNIPATVPADAGINYKLAFKGGHKAARHAAAELALKADAVTAAARAVLEWRVAEPCRGDLRDNDRSRKALAALAAAVSALDTAS